MPPLPKLSGREVRQTFESLGWSFDRQSGSHMVLVRAGHPAVPSIPKHVTVVKGTLRSPPPRRRIDGGRFLGRGKPLIGFAVQRARTKHGEE
jgi:predicted RNA binding protein YcfA (HicA-like mRNA interferase family)